VYIRGGFLYRRRQTTPIRRQLGTTDKSLSVVSCFLQGVSIAVMQALYSNSHRRDVCLAVCLTVCHTLALSENDAS